MRTFRFFWHGDDGDDLVVVVGGLRGCLSEVSGSGVFKGDQTLHYYISTRSITLSKSPIWSEEGYYRPTNLELDPEFAHEIRQRRESVSQLEARYTRFESSQEQREGQANKRKRRTKTKKPQKPAEATLFLLDIPAHFMPSAMMICWRKRPSFKALGPINRAFTDYLDVLVSRWHNHDYRRRCGAPQRSNLQDRIPMESGQNQMGVAS